MGVSVVFKTRREVKQIKIFSNNKVHPLGVAMWGPPFQTKTNIPSIPLQKPLISPTLLFKKTVSESFVSSGDVIIEGTLVLLVFFLKDHRLFVFKGLDMEGAGAFF